MVVARSEQAMMALGSQLADRSMGRRYLALVQGLADERFTIDAPLARDPGNRLRFAVVSSGLGGKPARTEVRRLASGTLGRRAVSLVECRLHTGRTHQIRVHMRSVGLPIVGDELYGGWVEPMCPRQALHAWRLKLAHPLTGRSAQWSVLPPPDMAALVSSAGIDLERSLESDGAFNG
jgi:23S rRNA pseudouridine1911/1915/1917 synthase